MQKIISILFLVLTFSFADAQMPTGMMGRAGGQNMNIGHFYGKVVDSKTNKGIVGASVQLTGNKFDAVSKKMKQAILKTVITAPNGDFSLDGLPVFGNFKLKIQSLGYKEIDKQISFGIKIPQGGANMAASNGMQDGGGISNTMQQMLGQADKDLGNIKMEADATDLGNVTVSSTIKPQFELGIDRKIFNVDKNLTSTGQTATEVMKSIPSLNVDIDGNVTLRNAAPTIFIDNRPTTLTLDQIPSDIIDKVEIITNPSAKYDASGGNAGIINIVLKKNRKNGYNGGIRTGVDSRGKFNGGGDINYRQNKVNFFATGMYMQRKSISSSVTDRNNLLVPPSFVHNTNDGTNEGHFAFIRGGLDYFVDNRNTISFTGSHVQGLFNNDNSQVVDSTISSSFTSYNNILSNSKFMFENYGGQLSYKHNFTENGHDLSADFNYNSSNNNSTTLINTQTYYPSASPKGLPLQQQTLGDGYNHFMTLQADYENPITDNSKFEAGVRGAIRYFGNSSNQYFYNSSSGSYVLIPFISSNYKYNDQVYAAYSSYSFKVKKWSYQLGLRVESSNYTGTLLNSSGADSSNFKVNYPLSLFPSAFVTYKLDAKQDFQLNYSRRVNRPNFFQLMPFPDYSDPQNINIGNANLKPEFTNSFEMSYNNAYKKGSNFLATVFFKYTTDLITRYVYRDVNAVSVTGDSAYFNTYINANYSIAYGLELSNKTAVTKWWDLTLSGNLYHSQINATIPGQTLDNGLISWSGKMNSNFKIAKGWTLQLSGDYSSKTVQPQNSGGSGGGHGGPFGGGAQPTAQGYILPRYDFDAALRKDWTWKKGQSGSLTLSMNDIFKIQTSKTYSESAYFTQNSERVRDQQVVRLNFSYRFGKFDLTLFKRKNTKADQNTGMDMMNQN
ncbi:TonB dependent receptor [mine drainage metagenome]|uniref:TonB dependent receptor n=1 Tax=mine drainage metagenome TaxID=410659 RepID=A0A1J5SAE6_9ZZZZ